jgi:UDP-N-acetyl-2-amino-2-deoxyglucuronate dehydrogenase
MPERQRRQMRVGLVGHGAVAGIYARILERHPDAHVVAVAGRSMEEAAAFASAHDVPAFGDVADMISAAAVDIAVVATPHPTHAALAISAMEAGAHVLVEKPMAVSTADCDLMLDAAERAAVTLGVVSQRRYFEPIRRMKAAIDAGRIGRPALATVSILGWRDHAYYETDPWRGTWKGEGGGVLVNQAVHHLDLLQWLFGPVVEVFGYWANVNHPGIEVDDSAVAVVRGADGRMGTILVSNAQRPGLYASIHVHGDSGASVGVQTDGSQMFIAGMQEHQEPPITDVWTIRGEEDALPRLQRLDREAFARSDPILHYHRLQVDDFIDAVLTRRPPRATGLDGRRAVALFEGIYRAQKTGMPQQVDEVETV